MLIVLILFIKLMKMQLGFLAYFSIFFLFSKFSNFRLALVMNSSNNIPDKEMLIKRYFETGLQYREIILILSFRHKAHVSLKEYSDEILNIF